MYIICNIYNKILLCKNYYIDILINKLFLFKYIK